MLLRGTHVAPAKSIRRDQHSPYFDRTMSYIENEVIKLDGHNHTILKNSRLGALQDLDMERENALTTKNKAASTRSSSRPFRLGQPQPRGQMFDRATYSLQVYVKT